MDHRPDNLQPPNDQELIQLRAWLMTTQRVCNELQSMGSPWAEMVKDFGEVIDGILSPDES